MYRTINDFIDDWKSEEEATVKIFSYLKDDVLKTKAAENVRTPGRLAWHITQTLTEMPFRAGIIEADHLENKPVPGTVREIIKTYIKHSSLLTDLLKEKWSDSDLEEIIEVYGQKWPKEKILNVLVKHQIHHRGQMTALMRLHNLDVPGIYGPSREEWVKYGMDPQD